MKKIVYIVLAAIMALVVILTAVILVVYQKRKEAAADTSPSPSVSAAVSPSTQPSDEVTASPSESPSPSPSDEERVIREETTDGIVYTIVADEELTYRLTVDEAMLSYAEDFDGQTFLSNEDENEYLQITFIADTSAASLAPSFLNAYLAFTEFDQSGQETISGTDITGEKVAVNDGSTQVEVWLVDTESGVLAVVISYTISEKDTQLQQLNAVLETLEIKSENEEGWADEKTI